MATRETSRRPLVALAASAAVLWVIVALVAASASQLRPIADDYCHAWRGADGYLSAVSLLSNTWIGDLFQLSVTALLVGQPLAFLPLEVASAIPFLLTVASVTTLLLIALGRLGFVGRARIVALLLGIPAGMILWWSFWWVPVRVGGEHATAAWQLATAVLHWQTVNVQYVLVPVILSATWLLLTGGVRRPRLLVVLMAALGLLTGLGGLVFGVAAVAFILAFEAVRALTAQRFVLVAALPSVAYVVSASIGLALAYLAPGARARADVLRGDQPLEVVTPGSIATWTFPESIYIWFRDAAHPGTFVVLALSIAGGVALSKVGADLNVRRALLTGGGFLGLSMLTAVASRAGEGFSYVAYWHEVTTQSMIFVAVVLMGVGAGAMLAQRSFTPLASVAVVLATTVFVVVALTAVLSMQREIVHRAAEWQVGAAPSGTTDIETSWVRTCWDHWATTRDLPERDGP